MARMKRFVTYIYAYENKKKENNVGFAKMEIRGEECRMEIFLRGVYARQSSCSVYLFREMNGEMAGVLLGEMKLVNGNGHFARMISARRIGDTPWEFEEMEGIFMLDAEGRIFMSRWKEGEALEVCKERFYVWDEEQLSRELPVSSVEEQMSQMQEEPTSQIAAESGKAESEILQESQAATVQTDLSADLLETGAAAQAVPAAEVSKATSVTEQASPAEVSELSSMEEDMQATELPVRNIFPDYEWQQVWESLRKTKKVYRPFQDRMAMCVQIELKELRELPRRYWYLGNNSFLLHGFFNYQYLVVGRTGDRRWFIGVPGIYQRQERVMAAIFGFPEFIATATDDEEGVTDSEPINRFGCWYRYIEE